MAIELDKHGIGFSSGSRIDNERFQFEQINLLEQTNRTVQYFHDLLGTMCANRSVVSKIADDTLKTEDMATLGHTSAL